MPEFTICGWRSSDKRFEIWIGESGNFALLYSSTPNDRQFIPCDSYEDAVKRAGEIAARPKNDFSDV